MTKEKFKVFEGVFDEFTLRTLETLKRKKYFDELGKPIKTGKEADVYYAYKDDDLVAIKIYRLTSANFKKISEYIARDHRFKHIKGNLRKVILTWVEKEYRNLSNMEKFKVKVPHPIKQQNNVIIMEHIDGGMLKDTQLEDPKKFFKQLIKELDKMLNKSKLIHGDLSEYNILVADQKPIIIDVGQAISIKNYDIFLEFKDLFIRDIENIVNYFNKRYDLGEDSEKIINSLQKSDDN